MEDPEQTGIPREFWSFETGRPFERCIRCRRDLLSPDCAYLIEKAFKLEEVVFEYALCMDCCQKLGEELSKDSRKRIEAFLEEHILDHGLSAERCMVTGRPVGEFQEHQRMIFCQGRSPAAGQPQLILSGEAAERVQELLSAQTRGFHDRFFRDYLELPPAVQHPVLALG